MEYTATAKYLRTSPRKMRLVSRAVSGKNAMQAVVTLKTMTKHAGVPMVRVLESAIANAKSKNATADTLVIKSLDVSVAPVMKRWHAVSRGSAHSYKKRMSHIKVVLTDTNEKKEQAKKT